MAIPDETYANLKTWGFRLFTIHLVLFGVFFVISIFTIETTTSSWFVDLLLVVAISMLSLRKYWSRWLYVGWLLAVAEGILMMFAAVWWVGGWVFVLPFWGGIIFFGVLVGVIIGVSLGYLLGVAIVRWVIRWVVRKRTEEKTVYKKSGLEIKFSD